MRDWLSTLDDLFPLRYATWLATALLSLGFAICWLVYGFGGLTSLAFLFLVAVGVKSGSTSSRATTS
jgi:hypothetical protein